MASKVVLIYMADSALSLYSLGVDDFFFTGMERRVLQLTKRSAATNRPSANTRFEKVRLALWVAMFLDLITCFAQARVTPARRTIRWSRVRKPTPSG